MLKLLKHFPQQALWMMIAISKVTLQCSYSLAIHDVIVSEVVTKAIYILISYTKYCEYVMQFVLLVSVYVPREANEM